LEKVNPSDAHGWKIEPNQNELDILATVKI